MLDDLDKICWSDLTHAFGSAADVPRLIQALLSESKDERDDALGELYGNVWHQGTIYEATSHAVPFLIEMLTDDRTPGKDELLMLLAHFRLGSSYLAVHGHLGAFDDKRGSPSFQEKLARERAWVAATHHAVDVGLPVYLDCFRSSDERVRAFAAHLIGCCHEAFAVGPLLGGLAAEGSDFVVASILFALSDLRSGLASEFLRPHLVADDFGVRTAAAVATARCCASDIDAETMSVLARAAADYHLLDPYEALPKSTQCQLSAVVAETLTELGSRAASVALPLLLGGLAQTESFAIDELVDAILGVTFERRPTPLPPELLLSEQRRVLQEVVDTPAVWQASFRLIRAGQFQARGLPGSRRELQELLAK